MWNPTRVIRVVGIVVPSALLLAPFFGGRRGFPHHATLLHLLVPGMIQVRFPSVHYFQNRNSVFNTDLANLFRRMRLRKKTSLPSLIHSLNLRDSPSSALNFFLQFFYRTSCPSWLAASSCRPRRPRSCSPRCSRRCAPSYGTWTSPERGQRKYRIYSIRRISMRKELGNLRVHVWNIIGLDKKVFI